MKFNFDLTTDEIMELEAIKTKKLRTKDAIHNRVNAKSVSATCLLDIQSKMSFTIAVHRNIFSFHMVDISNNSF